MVTGWRQTLELMFLSSGDNDVLEGQNKNNRGKNICLQYIRSGNWTIIRKLTMLTYTGLSSVLGSMLGTTDTKTRGKGNFLPHILYSRFLKQNSYEEILEC